MISQKKKKKVNLARFCVNLCDATHLVNHSSHKLRVRLLIGQELSNDLVHDILWWKEVIQKLWQNPGHHPSLTR